MVLLNVIVKFGESKMSCGNCNCAPGACKCSAKTCGCPSGECKCSAKDSGCTSGECKCPPGECKCSAKGCGCASGECKCPPGECKCPPGECKGSCGNSSSDIHKISCDELKAKMDAGDVLVVNVLDSEYYNDCHIAGTKHVPLPELEQACADWDKDKKIVVYCARYECSASKEAAKLLGSLGFTQVCAYEGGTKEWKQKGLPCEGACEMDYLG